MTTASIRFSLLAVAMLQACGSGETPTSDQSSPPVDAEAPLDAEPDASLVDASDSASDRAVEVFEAGAGDATVVFEAGFGNDWSPWRQVIDEVAPKARVFAYSRPGYGRSEPADEPRDAAHIVEGLRSLLVARGVEPPYVLVGHSFGGTYMELFAKAHPDEVAALVLVDPRHRDFSAACETAGFEGCGIPPAVVASLPPVQIAEYEAFASTSDEIRAAGAFGTYPVRVLTATSHGFAPEIEALWVSMLESLADEAPNGEQKIFSGAGHLLQTERPREVAEVILSLVKALGT